MAEAVDDGALGVPFLKPSGTAKNHADCVPPSCTCWPGTVPRDEVAELVNTTGGNNGPVNR